MVEYVTVLGMEYTMDDARNLWLALSEIFGISDSGISDENMSSAAALMCPCTECGLYA